MRAGSSAAPRPDDDVAAVRGWTAIVLAGERPDDRFAAAMGVVAKALIPVAGEAMLARVVRTLLAVAGIVRIVVLSQTPERLAAALAPGLAHEDRLAFVRGGDGISASLAALLEGPDAIAPPVLVTTADHPLLTPAIVAEFLAGGAGSDLAIGFVARSAMLAAYPDTRRTWLRFADDGYTGANLFALRGPAAIAALRFWSRAERDRKRRLRLFWHFGPYLFVRVVTRTIALAPALARAGATLGLRAVPVALTAAEAGIDVDKPADLRLAEAILARRAPAPTPAPGTTGL